jgi:uncharacterized protein (TIGR02246 family)
MPTPTEDREAIRDVLSRYCIYQDTGRAADWARLFAVDGEFALGGGHVIAGRQALEEFASSHELGSMHHMVTNHVIDLDGDQATCEASALVMSQGSVMMTAHTVDRLTRVDGRWQISHRSFTPDRKSAAGAP